MLGVYRTAEMATAPFHIGALSGAAAFVAERQALEASELDFVATTCVLLINGAIVSAEIGRVKVRQYARKHEEHPSAEPPEEGRNA